jgi:hypothetical protein
VRAEALGDVTGALLQPVGRLGNGTLQVWVDVEVEVAAKACFPQSVLDVVPATDVHRSTVVVDDVAKRSARFRHGRDVPLERSPVGEAQLAREAVLCLCEVERKSFREPGALQAPLRVFLAGLRGLQQVFRAFLLLLEIETERSVRLRVVSAHASLLSGVCVRSQTEKRRVDGSVSSDESWAQPFPRTWMLRPSEAIVRRSVRGGQSGW